MRLEVHRPVENVHTRDVEARVFHQLNHQGDLLLLGAQGRQAGPRLAQRQVIPGKRDVPILVRKRLAHGAFTSRSPVRRPAISSPRGRGSKRFHPRNPGNHARAGFLARSGDDFGGAWDAPALALALALALRFFTCDRPVRTGDFPGASATPAVRAQPNSVKGGGPASITCANSAASATTRANSLAQRLSKAAISFIGSQWVIVFIRDSLRGEI